MPETWGWDKRFLQVSIPNTGWIPMFEFHVMNAKCGCVEYALRTSEVLKYGAIKVCRACPCSHNTSTQPSFTQRYSLPKDLSPLPKHDPDVWRRGRTRLHSHPPSSYYIISDWSGGCMRHDAEFITGARNSFGPLSIRSWRSPLGFLWSNI